MNEKRMTLVSVLLAVYFGLAPINQTLTLSNGSTVNKYLALVIMILLVLRQLRGSARTGEGRELLSLILPIAIFGVFSLIWTLSFSGSLSTLISELEYMIFAYLVCCEIWSKREKTLFMLTIVVASVLYSLMLIDQQVTGRSTITILNDDSSDPNMLSVGISFGIIIALRIYLVTSRKLVKYAALFALGTSFLGILNTGSRGGLIACIVGCGIILIKGKGGRRNSGRVLLLLLLAVTGLWLILTSKTSVNSYVLNRYLEKSSLEGGNGRLEIWGYYFSVFNKNPYGYLIGYGFGLDSVAFSILRGSAWRPSTHNDYISILCYGGIVLLAMFYRLIKRTIMRAKRMNNIAGMGILFVALAAILTLNCIKTPIWWNALILAYIGLDFSENRPYLEEYQNEE